VLALVATFALGFVATVSLRAAGIVGIAILTVALHGLVAALCGASAWAVLGSMAVATIGCNAGFVLALVSAVSRQNVATQLPR
jgi:hypothetical protein